MHRLVIASLLSFVASAKAQDIRFVNEIAPPNGDGQSWSTAYQTVQDALAETASDPTITQVWIARGTYAPAVANSRDDTFLLVGGVALYGGFAGHEDDLDARDPIANPTVLSGDFAGDDDVGFINIDENARHVISALELDAPAVLDSLTIRGGNADFPGEDLIGGGGLFVADADVVVRRCHFEANSAGRDKPDLGGFGGAAYLNVGSLTIADSTFHRNRATSGGAIGNFEGRLEVADCDFEENAAAHQVGGVMWAASDTEIVYRRCLFRANHAQFAGALFTVLADRVELVECEFRENTAAVQAGACWLQRSDKNDTVTATIDRCIFAANTADSRGALILEETDTLLTDCIFLGNRGIRPNESSAGAILSMFDDFEAVNCLFSGNSADFGGAVQFFRNGIARMTNCTLSGNRAAFPDAGGGILIERTVLDLTNSILFGNMAGTSRSEFAQVMGTVRANFNAIENWTGTRGGVGNHGLDPRFADPVGADGVAGTDDDDLRITAGSPAIDAADNFALRKDVTVDLDGAPRFVDDPDTKDTGNGDPPLVDMGAFEFQACLADLDGSGDVGFGDILAILSAWGNKGGAEDLDGSGVVDFGDLLIVLAAWGPCE